MIIVSLAILLGYISIMLYKYGVPDYLSDLAYLYNKDVFTMCIGGAALLMFIPMMTVIPENIEFLGFLCVAALVFVSVAPMYKDQDKVVHKVAAYTSGILGIICSFALCWQIPTILISIYLLAFKKIKKRWFFAELTALISVYSSIIYNYV